MINIAKDRFWEDDLSLVWVIQTQPHSNLSAD